MNFMNKQIAYIFTILALTTNLLASFGIKIGSYDTRPAIPEEVRQTNLPTQIIQQNGKFILFVGSFDTQNQAFQAQDRFEIQGEVDKYPKPVQSNTNNIRLPTNESYAVEILSARDIKSVPPRILTQVFSAGISPVYIMDQGLYRLVVGPFETKQIADRVNKQLVNVFGRDMYTVSLPTSRFRSAIDPKTLSISQNPNNIPLQGGEKNEHLGYLEQQRAQTVNKYAIDPYGTRRKVPQGLVAKQAPPPNIDNIITKPTKDSSGLVVSIATTSSKNEFAVNGKKIQGTFSHGVHLGYRINDNTLFMASYYMPETKLTTVFLKDDKTAVISSGYEYMTSSYIKYRYFLPTFPSLFLSLSFGVNFTKQNIVSQIPLNFGTNYSYKGWYISSNVGIGAGVKLNRKLAIGIQNNAHITIKTITSSSVFYLNYEF